MFTITTLASLLGGSLGTLIITKILDFYSKKAEFKQGLQRHSYERKLEIAENAIAFFSYYRYNTIVMQKGLEAVLQAAENMKSDLGDKDNDIALIQQSMANVAVSITEMFQTKYQDVLSMNLYFEFEDDSNSSKHMLNYFIALGETKAIDNDISFWIHQSNLASENGNEDLADQYWNKALESLPPYIEGLKNVVQFMELDTNNSVKVIETIKAQIKVH